jgi:hypothetical protein
MDPIYHYTDGTGLLGIVQTRTLWLTHIAYLNDASEYTYARQIYERAIEKLSVDPTRSAELRADAKASLSEVQPVLDTSTQGVFVASFSEALDDLGQWRGYAGTGARFCIGFSVDALKQIASTSNLLLQRVAYGEQASIERAQAAFESDYNLAVEGMRTRRALPATNGQRLLGRHAHDELHWSVLSKAAACVKMGRSRARKSGAWGQ